MGFGDSGGIDVRHGNFGPEGDRYVHGGRPWTLTPECDGYLKGYYVGPRPDDAEAMTKGQLKKHLCSRGPAMCGECGLCAYGREYVRREREKTLAGAEQSAGCP